MIHIISGSDLSFSLSILSYIQTFLFYFYSCYHAMLIPHPGFSGEILDAGVNRSPSAYLNNPASERSKYKYDVDKEMTLLKFVDDEWGPIGAFSWFATHGTSMSRTNSLISGDNKGAAARFMEDWYKKKASENELGSSNPEETEALGIPRRVSNVIPNLQEYRKLKHLLLLELRGFFFSPWQWFDLCLQIYFGNYKVCLMYYIYKRNYSD